MSFNIACLRFKKLHLLSILPRMQYIPVLWLEITHNCSQQMFMMSVISSLMCSFNCQECEVCLHTLWLSGLPRGSSRAQGGQEIWVARQCHQNVQRCIRGTWLSNIPLSHVLCMRWHRLAKTWTHYPRRLHPLLTFPALASIVFSLRSLYICVFYMPGRPRRTYKHTLKGMLLFILRYCCISYILPHLSQQRSQNRHTGPIAGTIRSSI